MKNVIFGRNWPENKRNRVYRQSYHVFMKLSSKIINKNYTKLKNRRYLKS